MNRLVKAIFLGHSPHNSDLLHVFPKLFFFLQKLSHVFLISFFVLKHRQGGINSFSVPLAWPSVASLLGTCTVWLRARDTHRLFSFSNPPTPLE